MAEYEIVSQFTEDTYAKEDRICDRPVCRAKIKKGEPCFYVATINPGQLGCNVCALCYSHYKKNLATSVRPTRRAEQLHPNRVIPDLHTIQQLVNAAQCKLTINPPPVVAMPRRTAGPDIMIPTSWQGSSQPGQGSSRSAGSIGYSSQHALYATERERWAKISYATPPAETILIEISAVHEGGGRKNVGFLLGYDICEGKKGIDAQIDAPGLIELAFGDYLQDSGWVDLSSYQHSVAYFYDQCQQLSCKGSKTMVFKSKQFTLMVVVPKTQWIEYENWREDAEMNAAHISQHAARKVITPQLPSFLDTAATNDGVTTAANDSTCSDNVPSNILLTATVTTFTKRTHQHTHSSSSFSTPSSPRKRDVAPTALCLPNCDRLKEVLRISGGTDLDVKQATGPYKIYKIARYSLAKELSKLFREANVLYWAKSLLKLTYDFIDHCIASSSEPPPFQIPPVCFVEAGLALAHDQGGSKPGGKTGSTCAVFLLKEFIDSDREDFVKFIHNMDANPLIDYDDYGVFLLEVSYIKVVKRQ
ncbi:hypothetical protein BDR03DRAFT_1019335 [Suillus americanus]|nr:hypothetical protein BDR03DRAFT_1019335 [Suillus americanus]